MPKFNISRKLENLFSLNADNYTEAANRAARKLYGKKATANRTTGEIGKSGYFQAYMPMPRRQRGQTSIGEPFHVQ